MKVFLLVAKKMIKPQNILTCRSILIHASENDCRYNMAWISCHIIHQLTECWYITINWINVYLAWCISHGNPENQIGNEFRDTQRPYIDATLSQWHKAHKTVVCMHWRLFSDWKGLISLTNISLTFIKSYFYHFTGCHY